MLGFVNGGDAGKEELEDLNFDKEVGIFRCKTYFCLHHVTIKRSSNSVWQASLLFHLLMRFYISNDIYIYIYMTRLQTRGIN